MAGELLVAEAALAIVRQLADEGAPHVVRRLPGRLPTRGARRNWPWRASG
jgi:hypothetical protein